MVVHSNVHDRYLHISSVQGNPASVLSVVHEKTPGKTASSFFSTPEGNIIFAFCAAMHVMQKAHSRLSCKILLFFFFSLNKIIIIIIPQASTRYCISDLVCYSSDYKAKQCPTRVDEQDVFCFSFCQKTISLSGYS